jgi:hypothetical protein
VSYESYEQPYEEYDPNQQQQPYYGNQYENQQYENQYGQQYPEQPYQEQPYAEQQQYAEQQPYEEQQYQAEYQEQPYQEQPYQEQPYQDPQYQEQYRQPQPQDPQWAQSGLGWEQQAWDEARLGVSPLQDPARGGDRPQAEQGYGGAYTQVNELSGTDFQQFKADLPRDLPVPDYPPEYERYEQYSEYPEESPGFPRQRAEADELGGREGSAGDRPSRSARAAVESEEKAEDRAEQRAAAGAAGRGAFGAAGIGAVAAVAAVASTGALLVVVALIQAAIAFGWQQAVGIRHGDRDRDRVDRRAVVLTALIGWVATIAVYRLSVNSDFLGIPVTLGVGFLLLAGDQTLRPSRELGDGEGVAGLGIAVAGALFTVLPAGFVVSERLDSGLTAACASAAALGVLCCALLGRNPLRGIFLGLMLGAAVGAYAGKALQANGGLQAGALGGAVAALAAATAVGALDRIVAEAEARGSTRIVSQVLPVALAAVGALIASAVFR